MYKIKKITDFILSYAVLDIENSGCLLIFAVL